MFILLVAVALFGYKKNHYTAKDVKYDSNLVRVYIKQLNTLSDDQKYWLAYVYKRCVNYNLGLTCVAIAWEESQFGVYKVIPWTNDYGLMGINLYWYMKDNGYSYRNRYLRSRLATKLTCDNDYNIMYAISKLEKLKEKYHNWFDIWAHYNGGSKPNWEYAKRILNKIIAFKHYLSKD
jgi:hypothetical protein